jgi:hypothetical protein
MLNPFIVGAWDGTHIWLQWNPPSIEATEGKPLLRDGGGKRQVYEVRFRFAPGSGEFGEWLPSRMVERYWLVYNAQNLKPGCYAQAEISDGIETGWQRALGAKFVRSVCRLSISSERRTLHYPFDKKGGLGVIFHAVVDGAACAYCAQEEIEVPAGKTREYDCVALASGPWAQIDNAGDFLLRPGLGVTVTNIEPSRNDLEPTGLDFTQLVAAKRDGPISVVALPKV